MDPVLVVGSVALDTLETPFGTRESELGGAAVHFSISAGKFAPIRLVGIVGKDFPAEHRKKLEDLGMDLAGLETVEGETFRWHGKYEGQMNAAETVAVALNVFGAFRPTLPASFVDSRYVHLGTADPSAQAFVLDQLKTPAFVLLDTIEFWIGQDPKGLMSLLPRIGALCINNDEALQLTGKTNLVQAMKALLDSGLPNLIVKRAEHGATLATPEGFFSVPSYPTEKVVDPTGAGDSFAGGVLGYLASVGGGREALRQALVHGSVMGSFAVEGFGTEGLDGATREDVEKRVGELLRMMQV